MGFALPADVNLKRFMESLDNCIHWYNEARIKRSLGDISSPEFSRSLGSI